MTASVGGNPYYVPSGRLTIGGLVMMLIFGVIGGLLLGAAYGYLIQYNPLVYVNFLATLFVGVVVGVIASVGISRGAVRSPGVAALLGVVVGVVALYVSWVFWMHALTLRAGQATWLLDPAALWEGILVVNKNGAWSMKGTTPTGGVLWAIWGIEAVLIVGICAAMCRGAAGEPYCEACGRWSADVYKDLPLPCPVDLSALRNDLEAGNVAALKPLAGGAENCRLDASLSACPGCPDVGFLTVRKVDIKTDRKGKTSESKSDFVKGLALAGDGIAAARGLVEAATADGTATLAEPPAG
ncbi:MAG: hypothetical protein GY715_05470 [Planctomycetes bacterium]|nr:hypothetical protein [Planctomycetota bacterium]